VLAAELLYSMKRLSAADVRTHVLKPLRCCARAFAEYEQKDRPSSAFSHALKTFLFCVFIY
jgi:hypothetical protein